MIIGFDLTGYDNDSYMTGSTEKLFPDLPFIPKCEKCGYRTDYRYTNKDFVLKRHSLDFSSTYDGITIVSLKFKEFCLRYGYKELEFVELPKTPYFYQFQVIGNVLEYEASRNEKLCAQCGQYESVIGPSMKLERITAPLADGFYQSDKWFGSGNEKSPITIISPITKEKLDKEKLKNICTERIEF